LLQHAELLQRAEYQRHDEFAAKFPSEVLVAFEDANRNTVGRKLVGQHHACRPCADDDNHACR